MLQANITMKQVAKEDSTLGQLASARFLAGLIYELNGEWDDALISYRRCYTILDDRGEPIPEALQVSLLNLTKRQGFDKEYKEFRGRFGREARLPDKNEGEWFLIYFDGVVSNKTENRISVFDAEVDTMVSVVMPHYPPSTYRPRSLTLVGAERQRSAVVENLEVRAREDLEAERAKILATATVRAVAKYKMVQEAQSTNDFGGILMNIATVMSEQADVRSWNMLPASLQVARITSPLEASVSLAEKARSLPAIDEITRRRRVVVLANSLSDRIYTWPPLPASEPAQEQDQSAHDLSAQGEPHATP